MHRILIIDNYDSFVYNIVHLIKDNINRSVDVVFNNKVDFSSLVNYDIIILSPGPGIPSEANDLLKCIDYCKNTHTILGICLGHQAIYEFFGGKLIVQPKIHHGHAASLKVIDKSDKILKNMPNKPIVGLYNSWIADPKFKPNDLIISSIDENESIMSVYHKTLKIHGLQFHPESIISNCGKNIIKSLLTI